MISKKDELQTGKLEDDPLWREACDLAEYMYSKLHELPEEEKWDTGVKLRHTANDLTYNVSLAIGNKSPSNNEFDWGVTHKHAAGLKTMYRFACRQKFIELEPEIMVRLDKFIQKIDDKVHEAYEQTAAKDKEDFEKWHTIIAMQKEAIERK